MGHVEVAHLEYYLPDGRPLFGDISFRVGEGAVSALVGANGAGKTTLLRMISGELRPHAGTVTVSGGLGFMPQFIGSVRDGRTVRDLLVSVAPARIQQAARAVDEAEHRIMTVDDAPGPRSAAPRSRRGPAPRRAGQLPGRPRQAPAGGAHPADA